MAVRPNALTGEMEETDPSDPLGQPPITSPGQVAAPAAAAPLPPIEIPAASPPPAPPLPAGPDLAGALAVGPDVKTTRAVESEAAKEDRAALRQNNDLTAGVVATQTGQEVAKAGDVVKDDAALASDRSKLDADLAANRIKLDTAKQDLIAKAKKLRTEHAADYEHDFLQDKGTAAMWGAAIASGIGAYAASQTHSPNFAMETIQKAMDGYAVREKGRLQRQKEEIDRAGGDITEASQALRDYDTITRPQMESALLQRAGERRKALLNQYGASEAQVQGDLKLRAIKEKELQQSLAADEGLNARIETDNSEQNKLKRSLALGKGEKEVPIGEAKTDSEIRGAMTAYKNAAKTQDFTPRERTIIRKLVTEMRVVQPNASNPEAVMNTINKIAGNYYSQLSENGFTRLNQILQGYQDLERLHSGARIGGDEIGAGVWSASQPNGLKNMTQRMRDNLPAVSPHVRPELEKSIGELDSPGSASLPPKQQAEVRARAATLLRGDLKPKDQAAVNWARSHPEDPRSAEIINGL